MSTLSLLNLLQTMHGGIAGVRSAPAAAEYPESINGASLPLALVFPETGQWDREDAGAMSRQERRYLVQVFVRAAQQGRGIGPAIVTITGLIQAFGEAYLAGFVLQENPQIVVRTDSGQLTDTGVALLRYAGVEYHGFQFLLRVYEHW